MFDCVTVTKPTILFLQDHWSSVNQWGDCTCLTVSQWQNQHCCFYRTTAPFVISEVTVHVWLSHSDKTYKVAWSRPLVLWWSVRWLYMFDCLSMTEPKILLSQDHWSSGNQWSDCTCFTQMSVHVWLSHSGKPKMLLLQDYWSSGNQWGDCTCLIVSQWQNLHCCFYRTTDPLVISEVTVHVWMLTVTKPTLLLLQDHWSSGNQWGDCTCLIVSLWQNLYSCFLVIRWLYMFDCLTVTKPTLLFLQDHWYSCNHGGDCTTLIVSQWENQKYCFYRTTGPFVISNVAVHVWLSHSDKTNSVVFTGPLVLW